MGGEERLFLMSARETGQGGWEIQFGYSLDGVQVRLGEDGWAARFTVEQGQITGFQLRMRPPKMSGGLSRPSRYTTR